MAAAVKHKWIIPFQNPVILLRRSIMSVHERSEDAMIATQFHLENITDRRQTIGFVVERYMHVSNNLLQTIDSAVN